MRFSRQDITHQAEKAGWTLDMFERAVRLLLLLEALDRHPFLRDKLLLKGGTALNLFHLDVPRLSVDIDLNFIGAVELKEAQAQRPEIERAVTAVANNDGYGVSLSADAHAGRKLYLQYVNLSGLQDRIEVDINYLFRRVVFPPERRHSKNLLAGWTSSFSLVNWRELIAGKCLAALERVAPRDIHDLAGIHGHVNLQDPALRAMVVGLSAVLPHPLYMYKNNRFDRVSEQKMETELRPFLRRAEALDFRQLRSAANIVLSWILKLNNKERLYVARIGEGRVEPELLLPGDAVFCNNLRQHPALLWKIHNVRAQARKQ